MFSVIGLLPLTVQAQFPSEPADFDRLLVGEMVVQGQAPVNSNCKTGLPDCAGVLNVRFGEVKINAGAGDSNVDQLEVRIQARAGQNAIGDLTVPATCRNAAGTDFPGGTASQVFCDFATGETGSDWRQGSTGDISEDMQANVMHTMGIQITYSRSVFPNNLDPSSNGTPPCVGSVDTHAERLVADSIDPEVSAAGSLRASAIEGYSIGSLRTGSNPGTLTSDQVIQWEDPDGSYIEYMTLRCNLPTSYSNEMLGMSFQARAYAGVNSQHVGVSGLQNLYVANARNSLEFYPLDGSNYITHAEITEDGTGVLIEYAQAVTDNTNQAYTILTSGGANTEVSSTAQWLNDKTVWLTLGSSIYEPGTGVNRANEARRADRHVLVSSTITDTSFGNNFGSASMYRAVLTQHMSTADYTSVVADAAPKISNITVGPGTESIALTFTKPVCYKTETGCGALTADSFEVLLYDGNINGDEPTQLNITSIDPTGDDTVGYIRATLNLASATIGGTSRLFVRTARNSRFSDTFISDRTIFSQANQQIGMLHLQAGALVRAIPTISYELTNEDGNTNDYSADELDTASQGTTSTFTIRRTPDDYDGVNNVTVTIARAAVSHPTDPTPTSSFEVEIDGVDVASTVTANGMAQREVTFASGENTKEINIRHVGNTDLNGDYVYTITISPVSIPGPATGNQQTMEYRILDDEDNINPSLPNDVLAGTGIRIPGDKEVSAIPGATQVALRFNPAYDTVDNTDYTRELNYIIRIARMQEGKDPVPQEIIVPAAEATVVPSATESPTAATPAFLDIRTVLSGNDFSNNAVSLATLMAEIRLTREDYVFIPGDYYMVDISVRDNANNDASETYRTATFRMSTDSDLIRAELAGVTCNIATGGTALDGDGDGVANAYELSIGTDCNNDPGATGGVAEYIGENDPEGVVLSDEMFNLTSPTDTISGVHVVEAGVSTYTALDTGVTCTGDYCDNLKAFTVSSYLGGSPTADAVAMVTEVCPDPDTSSNMGRSCWVDDVSFVDGTARIPLPLGFTLIDWVAADSNGNLLPNSKRTQLIYAAPLYVLDGPTDLVINPGEEVTSHFTVDYAERHNPTAVALYDEFATIAYCAIDDGDPVNDLSPEACALLPVVTSGETFTPSVHRPVLPGVDALVFNTADNAGHSIMVTGRLLPFFFTLEFSAELNERGLVSSSSHETTYGIQHESITFGTTPNPFFIVDNQIRVTAVDEDNLVATMRETIPPVDSSSNPPDVFNPNGNPARLLTTMTQSAIEVPIGYNVRLGDLADTNNHDVSDLDQGDNTNDIVGISGLSTVMRTVPPGYEDEGVFEFDAYLPDNVNTAYAAIPLANPVPEPKGYYKFITTNDMGDWRPFERDSNNEYWSAPGIVASDGSVTCPAPEPSGAWRGQGILRAGDQCVLLQMTDNGNNDADGELNAVVADPGAPGMITFPFINMGDRSYALSEDVMVDIMIGGRSYTFGLDGDGDPMITDDNGNPVVVTEDPPMSDRYRFTLPDGTVIVFDFVPAGPENGGGGGSGAADLWFLLMLFGLIGVTALTRQRRQLKR